MQLCFDCFNTFKYVSKLYYNEFPYEVTEPKYMRRVFQLRTVVESCRYSVAVGMRNVYLLARLQPPLRTHFTVLKVVYERLKCLLKWKMPPT